MPSSTKPLRAEKTFDDEKYFSDSADDDVDNPGQSEDDDINMEDVEEEDEEEELDGEDSDEDRTSNSEPEDESSNIRNTLRTVDFGTLADAQSSLARDRQHIHPSRLKQPPISNNYSESTRRTDAEKVNTIRARLAELKQLKSGTANHTSTPNLTYDPRRSTISSRARTDTTSLPARSSKHAPTEQSSKHQVSRRRTIASDISSNPTHARDPRFTTTATASELDLTNKKYAFLADYRASELTDLKTTLSTLKQRASRRKSGLMLPDEEVTASRLRVAINRLENRAKAEADKERAREVVRRHKKEEKTKVEQGKKPFFLKKGEVRKRVLTEKFEGMKAKERDRAVKRRQKKVSERERRSMPGARRGISDV